MGGWAEGRDRAPERINSELYIISFPIFSGNSSVIYRGCVSENIQQQYIHFQTSEQVVGTCLTLMPREGKEYQAQLTHPDKLQASSICTVYRGRKANSLHMDTRFRAELSQHKVGRNLSIKVSTSLKEGGNQGRKCCCYSCFPGLLPGVGVTVSS